MATNNPYRAFVDSFARLLTEGEALGSAGLVRPTRLAAVAGARTALIFAPHPDDEVIIGGLPLRLLRELKMNVVNVAVTLGSRVDRQVERWQELKNCCDYIGFGLVAPAERGLEGINPAARDKDPQRWASSVKTIAELLTEHRPSIVFFPHDDDWNKTHIGVHRLLVEALGSSGFDVPGGRDRILGCHGFAQLDGRVECGGCCRSGGRPFAARGRGRAKCVPSASASLDDR